MTKEINELTAKATPVTADEIEIQETGGGSSLKATLGNVINKVAINRTVDINLDNLLSFTIDNAAGTPVDLVTLDGSDLLTLGDALCVGGVTLVSGAVVNITPAAGSAIVLDGTINVDAGVVTGATSITSTNFYGILTLPNTEYLYGRNFADDTDIPLIRLNSTDGIEIGDGSSTGETKILANSTNGDITLVAGTSGTLLFYEGVTTKMLVSSGIYAQGIPIGVDNSQYYQAKVVAGGYTSILGIDNGDLVNIGNSTIPGYVKYATVFTLAGKSGQDNIVDVKRWTTFSTILKMNGAAVLTSANGDIVTLESGGALNLNPAGGSAVVIDGTVQIDAGVITGATSITSTVFVGNLTGAADTVSSGAQPAITSLGTLTTLTVDNININGSAITGLTAADTTIDAYAGQAVAVEGVSFDGGVVTGASSISSTAFVGDLTGNADTASSADALSILTISTSAPSGGSDGDIWYVREA